MRSSTIPCRQEEAAVRQLRGEHHEDYFILSHGGDLADAWNDLSWEDMEQELNKIRQSSKPTLPFTF